MAASLVMGVLWGHFIVPVMRYGNTLYNLLTPLSQETYYLSNETPGINKYLASLQNAIDRRVVALVVATRQLRVLRCYKCYMHDKII